MFLAKTPKAGLIKVAVGALAGIDGARTTTALLELLPNAMVFRVTHSTHNINAVLKLKSEGFYHYSCNRSYFVDVNIGELFSILNQASDDDILTLSGHDPTTKILIKFEKRGQYKQSSIRATETINEHWTTDESAYQFYVALPSADFREKFRLFKQFDEFVKITLTEKMVKLKAGLLAVILNKEEGECMIEGIRGDVNCKVLVSLTHIDAILKGSSISSAVYIYDSLAVPSLRPLISCSLLGSFGTIMFFLPRPFRIFPPRI